MMLTWISEKGAKWVIYIFGAGIIIGLLSLGQMDLDSDNLPPVAKVDGAIISVSQFRQAYDGALAQYSSANLREEDRAQIRTQVLDQLIISTLTRTQMSEAKIKATLTEMKFDLLNFPPEEWKSVETFQTDGAFDPLKWQQFVMSDSVYDMPFMLNYELYLKNEKIPSMQLQAFVTSGVHATDAEARLALLRKENRVSVNAVIAPIDAFSDDVAPISAEELQKAYQAEPDSFWASSMMAKFDIVAMKVVPSEIDEEDGRSMLDWISNQLEGEMSFADLAMAHSADEETAKDGGSLGGFQPYDRWVPEFAAVAKELKEGEISAPVRTQFGWHLIRCNGKRISEEGVEEADLSHILVKVVAGNNTLDSLRKVLQEVSDQVTEKKMALADAAQKAGLEIIQTPWLQRSEAVPGIGALPGLATYGFAAKSRLPLSKIIENDDWMVIANRTALLKPGERDFSLAEQRLTEKLRDRQLFAKAEEYLSQKVKEWGGEIDSAKVASDEKLRWSSAEMVSTDGYLAGLGIASSVLHRAFQNQDQRWSEPVVAERAVAITQTTEKAAAEESVVAEAIPAALANATRVGNQSLVNDWLESLEKNAKIERNLDLFFSE